MEQTLSSLAILFCLVFKNLLMAQDTCVTVKVGVVVDMNDYYVGQMGLNCIKMALSDFYATNSHYRSRLVLHTRDSKNDVVRAASAALDLLKNVEVHAIIGSLSSAQADFIINLGDKARVPIITFSATSPSLSSPRSPYFIRATLNDSSQVRAIGSIVQSFHWREVVLIYVDDEFGEGIIPSLTEALEQVNARVPYRSVLSPSATDDEISEELYKLTTIRTRVFVVHMSIGLGAHLFTIAKAQGMMSKDYVWIITDGIANKLSNLDPSVMKSMSGVIGVRPYVQHSRELETFTEQYKRRIQHNDSSDLNIFGLWAYDLATALAMAVEKAVSTNTTFTISSVSSNPIDLEDFGVSTTGTELVQALWSTSFKGLAGNFNLVNGQLQSPPYEIINLVGSGARVVGYWTQEDGIVRDYLSLTPNINTEMISTSKNKLQSIIWPGDTKSPPKGWVIATNGKKLRIGVPVKSSFTEFLRVTWNPDNSTQVEGYCIDVFEAVIGKLPYSVQYEYVPFATSYNEMAGSYNDLVYQVYLENFDAVVGDVTIVANRSQYVDFTLPYTESGVCMVVPIEKDTSSDAWTFLKPLNWKLCLISFCSFIFIGALILMLEHGNNDDFKGPFWHQAGVKFWFISSTMLFAQRENIKSNLSRFVLIIWLMLVLILTSSYTASLSSMLTVQKLQPTVIDINDLLQSNKYVGYETGSFVLGLLTNMGFPESRLVAYESTEKLDELLSSGTVAAAFIEIPYLRVFLASHCSKYKFDPIYKTDGFAFVFPIGSPLVSDVSRAILNVTAGNEVIEIQRKWLSNKTTCVNSRRAITSNILDLKIFDTSVNIAIAVVCVATYIYSKRGSFSPDHNDESEPSTFLLSSPPIDSPPIPGLSSPSQENMDSQEDHASAAEKEFVESTRIRKRK